MADDPLSPIRVSYTRKTEVSIQQPEDVTRAKASAWLDILSPITQWAGLKGDLLQHKRQMLRLEQEATLSILADRVRHKLDGQTVTPVPAKQLVPILEMASLEDPESELIENWANLLSSAALTPGDEVRICATILNELSPADAQLLQKIFFKRHLYAANIADEYLYNELCALPTFTQFPDNDQYISAWSTELEKLTYFVTRVREVRWPRANNIFNVPTDRSLDFVYDDEFVQAPKWLKDIEMSLSVLLSRGLIERREIRVRRRFNYVHEEPRHLYAEVIYVSPLGRNFVTRVSSR